MERKGFQYTFVDFVFEHTEIDWGISYNTRFFCIESGDNLNFGFSVTHGYQILEEKLYNDKVGEPYE